LHMPMAVRAVALAFLLVGLALAIRTTTTSIAWIGRVFPGFVLLDNRVIASVGLAHWTGTAVPDLFQNELVAIDDRPIGSTPEAYAIVSAKAPDEPVRYRLRRHGEERVVTVATERFEVRDWILLHGVFLLNGLVFLIAGLAPFVLRPDSGAARGFLGGGLAIGFFLFTAMDLYGPATFFRLHVLAESMLPPAMLHFALLFPERHRFARYGWLAWVLGLAIAVAYQLFLYVPARYSAVLNTNMLYLAAVATFFCWNAVASYVRGASQLVRQRVRVVVVGAIFGFALPAVVLGLAATMAGDVSMNLAATTPFIFGVALAYAIVQHDLFEIDAMVKRGAYYLVLTGAVSTAYVVAVLAFNWVMRTSTVTDSGWFPVVFALAVLLLFNPLRTRVQDFVDRVFFGTTYDAPRVLAEIGTALAHARQRDQVAGLVEECLQRTIPNESTRLFIGGLDPRGLTALDDGGGSIPEAVASRFGDGRMRTAIDTPESDADREATAATRATLAAVGATVAVPMVAHGELVGALTLGAKRSGLFYTAGDADLLRGIARETAIALQHAAAYERIVDMNANLEARIAERTAQLQDANTELAETIRDLQAAESQLVHSEKMASLGRLVAGVAHEINNPVSFIANSVTPLRRRLAKAASAEPAVAAAILKEAEELVDIMANGAQRAAAIVKDLRTFSRLDEATRKPVDLHEGLEVSLRLLESRWKGGITLTRDYGALPQVECDSGQINQVFVNILTNACDAMGERGTLTVTTRADGATVRVAIRDDGPGIPPDVRARIFDPFFTTKDVGAGTGLGLSISHGIIAAHGGTIEVESAPGEGATFTVVLPVGTARLDTHAARGGR
jgi:signal transduction histidine kinase